MLLSDYLKNKKDSEKESKNKAIKVLKERAFSKESEQVCNIIFQKKIIYKKSLSKYFENTKRAGLIPYIDEGRELFRFKVLKKLGGYGI